MDAKPSIYEALAAVMADCDHVAKRDRNTQQNFTFRGIDAVVNAVGPVLRKHAVIVVPQVQSESYSVVQTTNGKAQTACRVRVRYRFFGPAGDDIVCEVVGEAWDSGDKATPKAMSVAFRTALLQALALPTDEADPDSQTYERAVDQPETPEQAVSNARAGAWVTYKGMAPNPTPENFAENYEQWCAQPFADATASDFRKFAAYLRGTK